MDEELRSRSARAAMTVARALHDFQVEEIHLGEPEDMRGRRTTAVVDGTAMHVAPRTDDEWAQQHGATPITGRAHPVEHATGARPAIMEDQDAATDAPGSRR